MSRRGGGFPARRAVVRWAWRMFRREWRQQLLVMALLTVTVAGALLLITTSYNLPDSPAARFGTASQLIRLEGDNLSRQVANAREIFGTIDVVGERSAPIPGLTRSVEIRAQDPNGPYGRPMLRVASGRYPTGAGEVAVTDEVATLMGVRVGGPLTLDGHTWTVVGIVENPGNLDAEFVLVPPAFADPPASVTILAGPGRADTDRLGGAMELREQDQRTVSAAVVFGLVALAMLLVGLVAMAAFVAVAQRRRRQFGLLAATGATERHVGLVLLAGGAVAGGGAAVLGSALAVPLWIAVVPPLETATGHRIGRLDVPWWLAGGCLVLAVLTAVGAAWWPGRAAARIPITEALSMRPPRPRPAHRSAILAALLLGGGAVCLRLSHQNKVAYILAGIVLVTVGLTLLGAPAIRLAGAVGGRLPVAPRLALRDLARFQARSGAALAAISLALAVPAFIVVETAAAKPPDSSGYLSSRQLLIRAGAGGALLIPDWTAAQRAAAEAAVSRFTATLGTPTVIDLTAAVDPKAGVEGGQRGRMPVLTGTVVRDAANHVTGLHGQETNGPMYLATPELMRFLGVDAGTLRPDVDVLTALGPEPVVLLQEAEPSLVRREEPRLAVTAPMARPAYTALPAVLLNPAAVQRHGWTVVRAGWLVEAAQPLTTAQLAAARTLAVDYGLSVESRDSQAYLLQLRAGATGAGGVLALGVLAMTVGLIRGEAARDLRTLTATGATGRIRRSLAATTAGALALLGALLGTAVAYLSLIAIHGKDPGRLTQVPVVDLTVIVVGVAAVASAAAWLLAGREPRTLGRIAVD